MEQKKIWKKLIQKRVFIILLLLAETFVLGYTVLSGSIAYKAVNITLRLISLTVCLSIMGKDDNDAFKLCFVFLILAFPVFGGLFYLFFKFQSPTKTMTKRLNQIEKQYKGWNKTFQLCNNQAIQSYPSHIHTICYLQNSGGFPVYKNQYSKYFPSGEEKYTELINQLKSARHYIFIEYFIIQEGQVWSGILEVLKEKVKEGVLVRIIYDDMGCFISLPSNYKKQLKEYGIECAVFNSFKPILTCIQNNRDHRKIVVIDGKTAFTGGINLADYYMNIYPKHGYWKDTAVMIKGPAVFSFAIMFLETWQLITHSNEDYQKFLPSNNEEKLIRDGFVQPYADSPMDKENVCENVYLNIINGAKEYVYINTPYLIIDHKMLSALCLAAKNGVDVRIVTPYIWDKWAIHMTTRSYYKTLIDAGVKIYEYSPGFIHSKVFLSDDTIGTVGTANLDFRSLYLHFECGAVLYGTSSLSDIKRDFINTFEKSKRITESDCKCSFLTKAFRSIMRIIAPLL